MGSYNFKSVGKKASTPSIDVETTPTAIGIKTPLQLSEANIFAMHYNLPDQIHDNLRNLLLTNWGERLGAYNFGANLRELTSEVSNLDDFDEIAIDRIKSAVSTWMPFVVLKEFTSSIDNSNNLNTGITKITVTYNIPQLGIENKALQVSLYVI